MANYRDVYERLARRAIAQGQSNLEAFVGRLADQGVPAGRIEELLIEDLMTDGPIFSNFFRALGGAGEAAVMSAERAGGTVAMVSESGALKQLTEIGQLDDVIDDADPDLLAEIEAASAAELELTWIATLRNTCHLCLPLHGITRTREEWNELGYDPATIHPGSWSSVCHCQLIERASFDRQESMAPLLRLKEKGTKRTVRGVSSANIETAISARDKAMGSIEGRRVLRRMGMAVEADTDAA